MKKIQRNTTKRQELKDKTHTHISWFIDLESETSTQDTSLFDLNPFSWKIYVTGNKSSPVHKHFLAWLL